MATVANNRRAKRSSNGPAKSSGRATETKVYSYIRFSTPEQQEGDSERRQTELARQWADRNGYTFDESLRADRGLSGYYGHHRTRGNLGAFLKRVNDGDVPSGSILVIEEMRRLSREGIVTTLKETIFKLIDAGITIQTLRPEVAYDRQSIETNQIFLLVAAIMQAHNESEEKSEWGKHAWEEKRKKAREQGVKLTSICPEWLTKIKDVDEFKPIPEAVKSIRLMFRLKEKGDGATAITRHLNDKAPWSPPKGWGISYVKKTLANRAVLGEYQPHRKINGKREPEGEPFIGYYGKPIVDPGLFDRVQQMLAETRGKARGGQNGKASNVFQHLAKCAYCGGPMHFTNKGEGLTYLVCHNAVTGKSCTYHAIRYDECEDAILNNCRRLKPERVLPTKGEQSKLCQTLRQRVQRTQATLLDRQHRIDSLNERIETARYPTKRDDYEDRIAQLDAEIAEAEKQLTSDQRELQKAEHELRSFTEWQANLASLQKALASGDVGVRQRLNSHLREFIDRIEVFTHGHLKAYNEQDDDGDDFAEYMDAFDSDALPSGKRMSRRELREHYEFIDWVIGRRMTKEGRFLRVHFKTTKPITPDPKRLRYGEPLRGFIDVVPEGSLSGQPAIGPLWDQFIKAKRQRFRRSG